MNVVFFAKFNKENINLGNSLCDGERSHACYWVEGDFLQEDKEYIKTECSLFYSSPMDEKFKLFVSKFLWDFSYKPDIIVIKGKIFDFWAVASLAGEGNISTKCVSLIDNMIYPLTAFDYDILEKFAKNIILFYKKGFPEYFEKNKEMYKENSDFYILLCVLEKIILLEELSLDFDNNKERMLDEKKIFEIKKEIFSDIGNNIISGVEIA